MTFFKSNKILTIVLLILSFYLYNTYFFLIEKNPYVDKKSSTYINDLYASDERIYNNFLNTTEKKIYRELVKGTKIYNGKINIQITDEETSVEKVLDAIKVDHPELLNFGSATYSWDNDGNYKIKVNNATIILLEQINISRIERIVYRIKEETKNMSDYEKIKYVYEWMGENSDYDRSFTYMAKNQSAYNVFINKNAVCAGFAKASQIIFQNIGIESYGVSGNTTGPHMWNIIKYKGKYYFFDSTVATSVPRTSKRYYNGLKQTTMDDYKMDNPEWYPEIETTDMK